MKAMASRYERKRVITDHALLRFRERAPDEVVQSLADDTRRLGDWLDELVERAGPENTYAITDERRPSKLIEITIDSTLERVFALVRSDREGGAADVVITVLNRTIVEQHFTNGQFVGPRPAGLDLIHRPFGQLDSLLQGRSDTMAAAKATTIEEWFRAFFRANPQASIDAACKAATRERVRLGPYSTDYVAKIRREVRQEAPIAPVIVQKAIPTPMVVRKPVAPEPTKPLDTPLPPAKATDPNDRMANAREAANDPNAAAARRKRAEDIILDNPAITYSELHAKLVAEFGLGVNKNWAGDMLRTAREAAGIGGGRGRPVEAEPAPEPAPATLEAAAPLLPTPEPEPEPEPVVAPPATSAPTPAPASPDPKQDLRVLTWTTVTAPEPRFRLIPKANVETEVLQLIAQGVRPEDVAIWKRTKAAVKITFSEDE